MYYKTRNAKYLGNGSFLMLAGLLALVGIKSVFTLLCSIIFVWSWLRYFFWVLQTRHLFLWFSLRAPVSKAEQEEWLRNNITSVEGRLKRLRDLEMGYRKDAYSNSSHIQEMEVLARRFGFRIFETLEMEFE